MLVQKTRKSGLGTRCKRQLWDDDYFTQHQGQSGGLASKVGEVVFVAVANLFDDAMYAQTFEQVRDLAGGFVWEVLAAQLLVGETTDAKLALQQGAEQTGILFREEIKALVTMLVFQFGFSQFVQFCYADFGGGDGGDEFEIAPIGSREHFLQGWQTVDGLLHGSPTCRRGPIAMLHLTIVLEEGDVVDGGLDAQDETELIVQLDRERSHLMFEARAQPTLIEAISQLTLVVAIQLAAEESGNICGFDRMSQGFQERGVEGLQRLAILEDQVCGILRLHDAPMVVQAQLCDHRAIPASKFIQPQMQRFDIELLGDFVGKGVIGDVNESIIHHFVSDAAFLQLVRQPIVSVEVELQVEGTPGRNAQIAQPQLLVHEVKIVGHTFAAVWLQIRLACRFVMPRTIRGARLHSTQDMYQSRLFTTFLQDLMNVVFFAKILLANKLDLHTAGFCQHFRIRAHTFSQGLRKFGVIKDPNPVLIQIMGHALVITEGLQTAGEHNPIIATQNTIQFFSILFRKQFTHGSTPVGIGRLSNLTTRRSVLQYPRGKVAVGKASRFSPFSRPWRAIPCATFPFWFRLVRVRFKKPENRVRAF